MTTIREKIERAAAATDIVLDKRSEAVAALEGAFFTNGYGVFSDRSNVRANLRDAKVAVEAALTALSECEWPTNAEYEAIE
jgi:hypothetical protein